MQNDSPQMAGTESQPLQNHPIEKGASSTAVSITKLAELPAQTLLDERALAEIFSITTRTVRRMVSRFELPPPVRMAGRSTWITGRVLAHINNCAERAARQAEQTAARIELTVARNRPS